MPTTFFEVRPKHYATDEILYFRPITDPDKSDIEAVHDKTPGNTLQPDIEYSKDDIAALLVPDPIPTLDRARVVAAYLMTQWHSEGLVSRLKRGRAGKIIFRDDS